jgi:hypothetical protein
LEAEEDHRLEDHHRDLEGRRLALEDPRVGRLVGCRRVFKVDRLDRGEGFRRLALVVVRCCKKGGKKINIDAGEWLEGRALSR